MGLRFAAIAIVNRMVQYQLDRTLTALADPTRRAVVERLGRDGVATVSELAQPAGISLTGMKKHLRVLEEAGLVESEKVGRARQCRLGPNRGEALAVWINDYRKAVEQRYQRLDALLAQRKGEQDEH